MNESKLISVLQSRKFYASLIGLLSVFGIYSGGAVESAELIDAILVIVSTFVASTALESGMQQLGKKE